MGNVLADGREVPEETPTHNSNTYRYPPRNEKESYFGSHFLLGGERFEIAQPEAFLFGDNTDLNWIGPQSSQYYPSHHSASEITRTLNCLINVRRDSVKFVRCENDDDSGEVSPSSVPQPDALSEEHQSDSSSEAVQSAPNLSQLPSVIVKSAASSLVGTLRMNKRTTASNTAANRVLHTSSLEAGPDASPLASNERYKYKVCLTLDCDCPCDVIIHYFAYEDHELGRFVSKQPELSSSVYSFGVGGDQMLSAADHVFEPGRYDAAQLLADGRTFMVVIECRAEQQMQTQVTMCLVEKSAEGQGYVLKVVRQKLKVDGLSYLLQEIYGIENKHINDAMFEGRANECIICLSDLRDVLILPCRHLCLCNACAEALRHKSSNCPICRAPFRALLRMRALNRLGGKQRVEGGRHNVASLLAPHATASRAHKYERKSLIEALNGPVDNTQTVVRDEPLVHNSSKDELLAGAGGGSDEVHRQAAHSLQHTQANTNRHNNAAAAANAVISAIRGERRNRNDKRNKQRTAVPIQKVLTASAGSSSAATLDSGVGHSYTASVDSASLDVQHNHTEHTDENGCKHTAVITQRAGRPTSIEIEHHDIPVTGSDSDASPQYDIDDGGFVLQPMSRTDTATTVVGSDDYVESSSSASDSHAGAQSQGVFNTCIDVQCTDEQHVPAEKALPDSERSGQSCDSGHGLLQQ